MLEARRQSGPFEVVVIGASLGGMAALSRVLRDLPADFRAAIAVVLHRSPDGPGLLAEILNKCTPLKVKDASNNDHLDPGTVHIAPAGKHLLINRDESLSLSSSKKIRFARPAVDLLFKSGAMSLGERITAVVLTGGGSDGADGVRAVKRMGGLVIAQDRYTSEAFGMPSAAIATGSVDRILPLGLIADFLVALT
jgi:two-component system chemotaxis response regulator CheB